MEKRTWPFNARPGDGFKTRLKFGDHDAGEVLIVGWDHMKLMGDTTGKEYMQLLGWLVQPGTEPSSHVGIGQEEAMRFEQWREENYPLQQLQNIGQ